MADVIAADDQILTVLGTPAHQDMDVRIVGVPMIDGDPVQLRSEVALDVGHELAREGAEVRQFGGVLRRNGEAEMVAVVLAALGESPSSATSDVASNMRASAPSRVTPSRFR